MHVHLLHQPEQRVRQRLESNLDSSIHITYGPVQAGTAFEVLVAGRPSLEDLTASAALCALVIPFAGLPQTTAELLQDQPALTVYNLHHNAGPTAEMAVTLMLAAMKQVLVTDQGLRNGDWSLRYQPRKTRMAAGGEAVILGYGAVGQEVARRCLGLGMRVNALSRAGGTSSDGRLRWLPVQALDDVLPTAAALVICLPLTAETRGLMDGRRLALLPEDAVLVNVGRGDVVDEEALFNLLEGQSILGAGLDVWYQYPPDADSRTHTYPSRFPFHTLSNVVMTPHMAGGVKDMELRRMEGLSELLNQLASGKTPVRNRVDIERGY